MNIVNQIQQNYVENLNIKNHKITEKKVDDIKYPS